MTIPYQIRESRRAKRVSLRVLPPDGRVEVVIPCGHDRGIAPLMVEMHQQWIENQQRKMAQHRQSVPENRALLKLPQCIHLAAIGREVEVRYDHATDGKPQMIYDHSSLMVTLQTNAASPREVAHYLCDFLQVTAKKELTPWLHDLAVSHGLRPAKVTIRRQRSRWGSCSSKGNISLNAKLMLLPPELVESVMLHELAHLRHLNHAPEYWAFLAQLDVDYAQHQQAIRHCVGNLPLWAEGNYSDCSRFF
ncbi:MAG: SprT family zinc-dependent metalloprotease [Mariprofundales bacterium]|nr:SprT family zinc-dependent metalloprotease [Mariprofundales bacterium]